jgi:hypothetical protein
MGPFYGNSINFKTPDDVRRFFREAIEYRQTHKDESERIALYVFDMAHEPRLGFPLPDNLKAIRYEFGALEAPGWPEDDSVDPDEFIDSLWSRLSALIERGSGQF